MKSSCTSTDLFILNLVQATTEEALSGQRVFFSQYRLDYDEPKIGAANLSSLVIRERVRAHKSRKVRFDIFFTCLDWRSAGVYEYPRLPRIVGECLLVNDTGCDKDWEMLYIDYAITDYFDEEGHVVRSTEDQVYFYLHDFDRRECASESLRNLAQRLDQSKV